MADSGSDTETDDELFERLERSQSPPVDAPLSPLHGAPALTSHDAVGAANDSVSASVPVPITETVAPQREDQPEAAPETIPVAASVVPSVKQSPLPSSTPFVDSADDEPPRFQATPAATQSCDPTDPKPTRSSSHKTIKTVALPSLSLFQRKTLPPVQIGTSTSAAVAAAAAAAKREQEQLALQQRQATMSPPATQVHRNQAPAVASQTVPSVVSAASLAPPPAPVVAPLGSSASTQFKSPFSSLATQYQPPPPPVVGAPPTSYVPLRAPPVYGGPPSDYTPIPPMHRTPTIPCTVCTKVLPENASPIPLGGHGVCSCCRRYYPTLLVRQNRQLCTACVPPTSALSQPAPSSSSSEATRLHPTCGACMRPLTLYPPEAGKGKQCKCCFVWYAKHAFSKNQARLSDGKCGSCVVGMQQRLVAQMQNKKEDKKREKAQRRKAELAAEKKEREAKKKAAKEAAAQKKNRTTTNTAGPPTASASTASGETLPPEISQTSPEERHEMEVEVRNIKLARRSIHRRLEANDLRGSTRLEYETQLAIEEDKLNQKMVRLRRRNPVLFDWVNHNLKIKAAQGVAPSERDRPAKGKHKKPNQAKQKQKSPAQKRKASGASKSAPSPAKRARVTEPSPAPDLLDTKPVKPEVKSEAASLSSVAICSQATAHVGATRARRAKPIEIIDLVDSD